MGANKCVPERGGGGGLKLGNESPHFDSLKRMVCQVTSFLACNYNNILHVLLSL